MPLFNFIGVVFTSAIALQTASPPGKLPPPADSIGAIAFEAVSEAMPVPALSSRQSYAPIEYTMESAIDAESSSDRIVLTDGIYHYFAPRTIKSIRARPQRDSESPIPVFWILSDEFSFGSLWGAVPPPEGKEDGRPNSDESRFVRLVSRIGGTRSAGVERSLRLIESRGYDIESVETAYKEARRVVRESSDRDVLDLALSANGDALKQAKTLDAAMRIIIGLHLRNTIEVAGATHEGTLIRIRGGDGIEVVMLPTDVLQEDKTSFQQAWQWFEFDKQGWMRRQGGLLIRLDEEATLSERTDRAARILIELLTGRAPATRDGVQNMTKPIDR